MTFLSSEWSHGKKLTTSSVDDLILISAFPLVYFGALSSKVPFHSKTERILTDKLHHGVFSLWGFKPRVFCRIPDWWWCEVRHSRIGGRVLVLNARHVEQEHIKIKRHSALHSGLQWEGWILNKRPKTLFQMLNSRESFQQWCRTVVLNGPLCMEAPESGFNNIGNLLAEFGSFRTIVGCWWWWGGGVCGGDTFKRGHSLSAWTLEAGQ